MRKSLITGTLLLFTFLLFACGNEQEVIKDKEEESHSEAEGNVTTLTEAQMKSIGIELGLIEKKQLTSSLKANGLLKVPNQNKANATSPYGGVVKSIAVQPGSKVRKGQTIATISNASFLTMQEEYLSVSAQAELSRSEFDRQKLLRKGEASSQKSLQQAEAEYTSLQARKLSLKKQLGLIGISADGLTPENMNDAIRITSPISGSVSEIKVNIGTYLDANSPVITIVDNSQLHLDLYVYEKDLGKLNEGQSIHFTLTNYAGKEYDAKIFAISNTFEPGTKAVSVHALVEGNKDGLIDGMNITALVSLDKATVEAVPEEAIVEYQGGSYIFIVNETAHEHEEQENHEGEEHSKEEEHGHHEEGMVFERIPVRKGTTDIGYSEITLLKEIPSGAKIVTKGAFFVLAKMTASGGGHEH